MCGKYDERWYHFDDQELSIKISKDGRPFKIHFYDKDAVEQAREEDGDTLQNKDKVAPHLTPNGVDFLGSTWWRREIKENLIESPVSDFDEEDAKEIIDKLAMVAPDDLENMMNHESEEDEDTSSGSTELDEKAKNFLTNPALLVKIDEIMHEEMAVENRNAMLNFIVCVSCLNGDNHEPVNLDWSGRTSTGKTKLAITPLEFFPDYMVMDYIGMTEKMLYHDGEQISEEKAKINFENKILVVLEKENSRDALEQIKPILSHDKKVHTYKYAKEAGTTVEVKMEGWPVFIGCSVDPEQDSELNTRSMTATPEIGERKYRSVIDWKALRAWAPWEDKDISETKKVIRRAIDILEPMNVWIPYIPELRNNFPDMAARHQRDWDRLESIIAAVTVLHQFQRDTIEVDDKEYLVATPYDCKVALDVLQGVLEQTMMGLERDILDFFKYLQDENKKSGKEVSWTYNELMDVHSKVFDESISYSQVRERFVEPLKENGAIIVDKSSEPHQVKALSLQLSARFPDLEDILNKIDSFEYTEENLKERFLQASEARGDNPGPNFNLRDNNSLSLESLGNVYGEFVRRLQMSSGDDPIDWTFGGQIEETKEGKDDFGDLVSEDEGGDQHELSQKEIVNRVSNFYSNRYSGINPHKTEFVNVFCEFVEDKEDIDNVDEDTVREACNRLEEEGHMNFKKDRLEDFDA